MTADARRHAPAAERNLAPIRAALTERLANRAGHVLEIGAGTGQHVVALAAALPRLVWWPTDPDPAQRAIIAAHRPHAGTANLQAPAALDAAADWPLGDVGLPPAGRLAAVWAPNVLHIAPAAVGEGLLRGAARRSAADLRPLPPRGRAHRALERRVRRPPARPGPGLGCALREGTRGSRRRARASRAPIA